MHMRLASKGSTTTQEMSTIIERCAAAQSSQNLTQEKNDREPWICLAPFSDLASAHSYLLPESSLMRK